MRVFEGFFRRFSMRTGIYILAAMCALSLFPACDELSIVLSQRSAMYVKGKPEYLAVQRTPSSYTASILTNSGWTKMSHFSLLPERFAVQTGESDRAQIIMADRGVLDVYPGTLVVVGGPEIKDVFVLQGKCTFVPLLSSLTKTYASLQGEAERSTFLENVKRAYLEEKEGMFFARNPFSINTSFSSQTAHRGASFSIIIDSNRPLDFSNFRLDRLHPSFALICTNASAGRAYRYMAVTGLDIYENADDVHLNSEARDRVGNWIKMRTYIPTEAWRYSVLRGTRVTSPKPADEATANVFKNRFRAALEEKMKCPVFKRDYQTRLEQENRHTSFHLRSQQVMRQSALIQQQEPAYRRIFAVIDPEKYWQGNFIIPTSGVVTSGFGHFRRYHGGRSGRHRGIDIANTVGTDIRAPNAGNIVFTGHTPDRGHNIVIDHGLGVFTCFFHLAEIYVIVGDRVRTGDVVASLGNTGLSSGPHLHWEMVVNGRRVNPMEWVEGKY
jgi:murein DD-endopeptidase MepM/ murein hydrolase activator NlpD